MSVFLAIVYLSLSVGNSGEAIKPVVTFTPNWGNIIYLDSVTLTCNVPSTVPEEPRTYEWYRNQTLIKGDQQRLHIIRSSVHRDSGDYQCRTIGGDISDPVFLNVTDSFVILQRPPSTIYEGDPLTLRCHHVKDFIAINTKFYKDDEEIQSSETDSEFHIPNIAMSQSGLYKCTKQIQRYDSSTVQEKSDVSLISVKELFSPPEIKVTPPRVIEGGEMTMRCDTRLDPLRGGTELHFAFYRDGRTVREYDGSDTYRVPSARLEDSGKYTCEVRTVSGSVRKMSDGIDIKIYELPPPEIEGPSSIIEGGEMTVRCDTRLDPPGGGTELYFAFYRDGGTVRGYDVSDTYRVRSAQLEDSGKYTCEVRRGSDSVGKMSDEFFIQIYELPPPEIKVTPPRVIEGDEMTVRCDTRLDPLRGGTELYFAFYRDGRTVRGYDGSDTYRVQSAQLEDSGKYTCEVRTLSGTVGKMSDGIDIQIYELFSTPQIKGTSSRVIEGGEMTVRCDTRLDPLRGGTELHFAFYRDGRTVRGHDGSDTYRVRSAQLEDSGKYTCEVRRRSDSVKKRSDGLYIQIYELPPPEIKVTPPRVIEGGEMTVRCDTRLDPLRGGTELHFAFYRDGRTVRGYDGSDTYRVRSVQLEDSGKYTCEVRRGSVKKRSDELYIQIHELFSPPEIKVTPPRVIEGGEMTARCDTRLDSLHGSTELHFAFYRDGRVVRGYDGSDTYRVRSAQLENSGNYTCEVKTANDTVRKMSDGLYIQIHDKELSIPVIAAAVVGSLVVIIIFAFLIWKCKKRNRFSHPEPHQAIFTAGNNTDPNPQDVCYTYLDISRLPKGTRIKHDDLTVTYATVNNANI